MTLASLRRLLRRLRYLARRRQRERELQEEMRAHREMMAAERRAAFGSLLRLQEDARDAWGWGWLDRLHQDLVYGIRQLRRAPSFTLTAVLVLAFGGGLNLAVFHVVRGISTSRIPVADADSLVRVVRQSVDGEAWSFPPDVVHFLQEHADAFEYLVGERLGTIPVRVFDDEEDARAQFVSGSYFADLGVTAAAGRLLQPADAAPGAPTAVVLSDGFWQRRFGASRDLVASSLVVNGVPVAVVGVLPAEFSGLSMSRGDIWIALPQRTRLLSERGGDRPLRPDIGIVGRIRPEMTHEAASARLAALTDEVRRRFPETVANAESIAARPLDQDDRRRGGASVLGALVALVLLVSCANLANMLLARGLARQPELAARVAVGASRARLVRQLMTESLLVAVLGSIAGLIVAVPAARVLAMLFASGGVAVRIVVDLPVVATAVMLSVSTALAFGLVPALQLTGARRGAGRSRAAFVAVQVAASCVLLILSGLMVRGAERQTNLAAREDFATLVVLEPGLEEAGLPAPALRAVLAGAAQRIRELPEVAATSISTDPVYGAAVSASRRLRTIVTSRVDADYFGVMQLPLRRGRLFEPGDANVAILSTTAARAAFGDEDPIGRVWRPDGDASGPVVIGLVEPSPMAALRDPGASEVFLPMRDADLVDAAVILRTRGDGRAVLRRVRDIVTVAGAMPSVWLMQTPVDQLLRHSMAATALIGVLGAAGSGLAALGLFGLMAFAVRERTRELGVRIALGAGPGALITLLVGRYAASMASGVAAGFVLALAGERVLAGLRLGLGLQTFDPAGYVLGLFVFTLIALAAIVVPLRRALHVDPISALRTE